MSTELLKKKVCQAIDEHKDKIIAYVQDVASEAELGFKEIKTSDKTAKLFRDLGLDITENIAITGVKAIHGNGKGKNIAVLGEMDAVICPDSPMVNPLNNAAHSCGHHLQLGSMMGAAIGITLAKVMEEINGTVTFLAVPAEEYVEMDFRSRLIAEGKLRYLSGKQELIARGEFDSIDIAMMIHSEKNKSTHSVSIGTSSNGFVGKSIQYIGREAHAAESPDTGINALNAAMLGLMGIHAMRETFKDDDTIRVHPIITKGGDLVNSVPADVRMDTYVRAKTMEAIDATHRKVDRALRAGGDAVGAETIIKTMPGYFPLYCSKDLNELFVANAVEVCPTVEINNAGHFGASTDFGDVSHLLPTLHPFIGGVSGNLHSRDFSVVDYDAACILPAKAMAMTIIDLLGNDGIKADQVVANFKPIMTKEEYLKKMDSYFTE